jgi:hypothetical protein
MPDGDSYSYFTAAKGYVDCDWNGYPNVILVDKKLLFKVLNMERVRHWIDGLANLET